MTPVKKGNKVKVHYTGKFTDDTVFDSSVTKEPLEFEVGAGQMIEGFDKAVEGMELNEKKTITLKPEEAYGPKRDELLLTVSKDEVFKDMDVKVGQKFEVPQQDGNTVVVEVEDIKDDDVVLNGNHPLAGKELVFDIQLVDIQ
ncbi:MAG: peptidylprolyl isomerase [Bacteroidales bacterium]|nr:peptidylprolyl isomerase [Bacteroidales bacterium]